MSSHAPSLEEVVNQALRLAPQDQARRVARVATAMGQELAAPQPEDVEPLTDEEIADMLRPEPMTGTEIVAAGLTGGWADMGITDGAEWVQEQRRKRWEQHVW